MKNEFILGSKESRYANPREKVSFHRPSFSVKDLKSAELTQEESLSPLLTLNNIKSEGYVNKQRRLSLVQSFTEMPDDSTRKGQTHLSFSDSVTNIAALNNSMSSETAQAGKNENFSRRRMSLMGFDTPSHTPKGSIFNIGQNSPLLRLPPIVRKIIETEEAMNVPLIRKLTVVKKEPLPLSLMEHVYWIPSKPWLHIFQRPISTTDSTLVEFGHKAFLYGGALNDRYSNELWSYNSFKETWKRRESGNLPARVGHSASIVKSNLYIFGGEIMHAGGARHLSNDIYCYNPNLRRWNAVKPSSKEVISPRKYQALCQYKSNLFVYGGLGEHDVFLHDVWVFNTGKHA